jgi:hypothetical protein
MRRKTCRRAIYIAQLVAKSMMVRQHTTTTMISVVNGFILERMHCRNARDSKYTTSGKASAAKAIIVNVDVPSLVAAALSYAKDVDKDVDIDVDNDAGIDTDIDATNAGVGVDVGVPTGHGPLLQASDSGVMMHGAPPLLAGVVSLNVRVRVPSPHVTLQLPYAEKLPEQSTHWSVPQTSESES